jgi:hypothetical protein
MRTRDKGCDAGHCKTGDVRTGVTFPEEREMRMNLT